MSWGQVQLKCSVWASRPWVSHLFGVIVENPDGPELGADAVGLREGCTAVFVRALLELIGDSDIPNRRGSRFNDHLR